MITDESNVLTCFKRAFHSDVLEGVIVKNISGSKPQTPVFLSLCFDSSCRPFCVIQSYDLACPPKHWRLCYLCYLSVQPDQWLHFWHDILHGKSAYWCKSKEDFHRWYTWHCILYLLPLQWRSLSFCYHIIDEVFAGQNPLLQSKSLWHPPAVNVC